MPELVDKVALITGASSGIGRALAILLALAGARVAASGRNEFQLAEFAQTVQERGGHAEYMPADITQAEERNRLCDWTLDRFGGVDLLVHAAGIARRGPVEEMPDAAFDETLQINTVAPYGITHRLLPALIERKGQVAFINTRATFKTFPNFSAYCASKAALKALADGLRLEVRPQGVRVISVYPAKVDTPMLHSLITARNLPYETDKYLRPEDIAQVTLNALMAPRHVEVPDILIQHPSDE